jgi:hypothetical protein
MIDNVVNMIEGLKNKVDIEVLLANIDPLGWFPEIKNIKVLEGDDYTSLYRDVLIDVKQSAITLDTNRPLFHEVLRAVNRESP